MYEIVLYKHVEAGFEAFPAENYVDYMTNVMPVPESHLFFLPKRNTVIVCEVQDVKGNALHLWSLRGYDTLPSDVSEKLVKAEYVEAALNILGDAPTACPVCEILLVTLH